MYSSPIGALDGRGHRNEGGPERRKDQGTWEDLGGGHGRNGWAVNVLEFLYIILDCEKKCHALRRLILFKAFKQLLILEISGAVRIVLWGVEPYSLSRSNFRA